jgi:uncharacterized membrane protein
MIEAFNRRQTLLAVLNFALGGIAAVLAFLFFRIAAGMTLQWFGVSWSSEKPVWIAVACVVLVVILGILEHRRGGGHRDYHETDLFPGFDRSTGSGYWANARVQEVTAPAYFLSQIFLAAPLQVLRGLERLHSRLPGTRDLEERLTTLLETVNANPSWHPLRGYGDRAGEIGYLIRMEKVQFSPRKGSVRRL